MSRRSGEPCELKRKRRRDNARAPSIALYGSRPKGTRLRLSPTATRASIGECQRGRSDRMARHDSPMSGAFPRTAAVDQVSEFLRAVYGWMAAGLAITAATAWIVAGSPALVAAVFGNRLLFWA